MEGKNHAVQGSNKERKAVWLQPATNSSSTVNAKSRQVEEFCLTYGGMWKDFYDEIHSLKERNAQLTEALQVKTQELELMRFAQDELRVQFKESLMNLTEAKTDHTELQEIFEQLEEEKDSLKSRVLGLDDHLEWMKRQNNELQNNLVHWKDRCLELENTLNERNTYISDLEHQNSGLVLQVQERDERIAALETRLAATEGDKRIVQASLAQKCQQVSGLVKERNQLKEDLLQAVASATPMRRAELNGEPGSKQAMKFESKVLSPKSRAFTTPLSSPNKSQTMPPRTPTDLRGLIEAISPSQSAMDENQVPSNPWSQPLPTSRVISPRKASTPQQRRIAHSTSTLQDNLNV